MTAKTMRPPGEGGRGNLAFVDLERREYATATPAPQALADARLRHVAQRIHDLGARALAELLAEQLRLGGDLMARVERYADIDRDALVLTGGDRFPPRLASIDGATS